MTNPGFRQTLLWLTFFSIAMAFLESAVVVYLRELYYPQGFGFPLVIMPGRIAITEILREMATIIMLLAAGYLSGRNAGQRFAWFIYGFAVWDIFYYVFLKLLVNWPESLLTWDILFLIPVVWTGPVIAPIGVSLTMILLAATILHFENAGIPVAGSRVVKLCFITGAFLVFLSFIQDYSAYLITHHPPGTILQPEASSRAFTQYIPDAFNWWLFWAGEVVILTGIVLLCIENLKKRTHDFHNQI